LFPAQIRLVQWAVTTVTHIRLSNGEIRLVPRSLLVHITSCTSNTLMVLCTAPRQCTVTVDNRDNEPVFKHDGVYRPGDIGMIFASVKQPLQYQIEEADLSRAASRYTAQQLRDAYTELESRADGGKLRPCLILGNSKDHNDPRIPVDKRRPPPVALLATFGMADVSKFPLGVQHHLVPVYTTGRNLGKREHLHTTPDWDGRSTQYIIAYEYTPREHKVIGHFRSPRSDRMPYGTNYSVAPQALIAFNSLCSRRTMAWQRKSQIIKKMDAKRLMVR
jgi:hypothetical protein